MIEWVKISIFAAKRAEMKIGIIVAMGKELDLLLHLIDARRMVERDGYELHLGTIGNHEVCAMQCGIGKVNAAIGTMALIEAYGPELVINTGVAGGADTGVAQMDVVVGKAIAYHDVWCGPGTAYGEASGFPLYFRSDERVMGIIRATCVGESVKFGLICSGDKFIAASEEVDSIKAHFPDALAVDMESAAIAQVCALRSVPVAVFRVISDTPGAEADNVAQYENFWEAAPKHTFRILSLILQNIQAL